MTTAKLMTLMLIVFSLVGLAVPAGEVALPAVAQPVIDEDTLTQEIIEETEQEIEQEAEQEAEQEQEQEQENEQSAEQSNTADVSQDESNEQANVLETGDNTASTTQVGDNDAIDNEVEAESEGGDSGDASAYKDSTAESSGGDAGDAEAELEQEVDNTATTVQDSSADNNVLSNENEFGDDIAVVDQDNIAEQDAANIGIQEQDLTQTIDQVQDAENFNFDLNVQLAQQVELEPPQEEEPPTQPPGTPPGEPGTPPGEPGTPPGGGGEEEQIVFCKTRTTLGNTIPPITVCFETQSECESFEFDPVVDQIISECQRFEEPPPGALCFDSGRGRVSCEGFGGGGGENPQPP